jgi:hypothetical protein
MLPIFEHMFPGAVGEFFFDQSSAYGAFAPDALNSKEMNVKPGGKQRRMHATFIPNDNPNPELSGQPQHYYYGVRGIRGMRIYSSAEADSTRSAR